MIISLLARNEIDRLGTGDIPSPDFWAQIFLADLLSIKTVSGAKVAFPPPQQVRFYMANLALTLVGH